MALISATDQARLREAFAEMTRSVRLLFFTQTLDCETCLQTRQILDELPPLSDKITIDEVNLILEGEKANQYGIDRAPAIAVTYADADAPPVAEGAGARPVSDGATWHDSRIRFLGAPAGYEFVSLIRAVLVAGGRSLELSADSLARIGAVTQPVTMQVFTTPT